MSDFDIFSSLSLKYDQFEFTSFATLVKSDAELCAAFVFFISLLFVAFFLWKVRVATLQALTMARHDLILLLAKLSKPLKNFLIKQKHRRRI